MVPFLSFKTLQKLKNLIGLKTYAFGIDTGLQKVFVSLSVIIIKTVVFSKVLFVGAYDYKLGLLVLICVKFTDYHYVLESLKYFWKEM